MIALQINMQYFLNKAAATLILLPRSAKKAVVLFADFVLCLVTTWLAFCIRFDQLVSFSGPVIWAGLIAVILFVPIFVSQGLYRAIYRFSGWFAAQSMIKAALIYGVVYFILIFVINIPGIPRSIGIIQPLLFFLLNGLLRLFAKSQLARSINYQTPIAKKSFVLIYGAGLAGRQLALGLSQGAEIELVGFVDDSFELHGGFINGLQVYAPDEISRLIASKRITDILLAIPSASRGRQKEILNSLADFPVHVRKLPGLSHLANGIARVEDVREIDIDDVLGREPVEPSHHLLSQNLVGKVVLVTGAGGSIGSELCRQILVQSPKALVLFEQSEFALYAIERELASVSTSALIIPILGSVLDSGKLGRVIRRFAVQTVYHAAAYKHVPMIEMNPAAGLWNNVFGTLRAVESACKNGVETFVLVSTDKAVRPTNVMGCSKRIAELVLQAKNIQEGRLGVRTTKLTMVRFGNVLGSSGSVMPIFSDQIKSGGPVTVTHPEIIRYFMTIPEAAQLVIQAGAMGEGGDVMVLNMGEPVKILDLAKRMIHLSGFSHKEGDNSVGDIEIQFTGLRPGEKLFEELLIGGNTLPTSHPKILRAIECALGWEELEPLLVELESAIKAENSDVIRSLLKRLVPEFNSDSESGDILQEYSIRLLESQHEY